MLTIQVAATVILIPHAFVLLNSIIFRQRQIFKLFLKPQNKKTNIFSYQLYVTQ